MGETWIVRDGNPPELAGKLLREDDEFIFVESPYGNERFMRKKLNRVIRVDSPVAAYDALAELNAQRERDWQDSWTPEPHHKVLKNAVGRYLVRTGLRWALLGEVIDASKYTYGLEKKWKWVAARRGRYRLFCSRKQAQAAVARANAFDRRNPDFLVVGVEIKRLQAKRTSPTRFFAFADEFLGFSGGDDFGHGRKLRVEG